MTKNTKPVINMFIAMLIFGSIGVFVKNINLPSTKIVLWRTIIGNVFLGIVFLLTKQPMNISGIKRNYKALIAAGLGLGGSWALLYESYRLSNVSIATLLHYGAPAIVFLLSPWLFKEKMTPDKVIGIASAVLGTVILNGSSGGNAGSSIGLVYGLASALCYAGVIISNKFIKGLSGLETTFFQLVIAMLIMAAYIGVTSGSILQMPQGYEMLLMAAVGILHTGIACYIYFTCVQQLPGQTIAIISYIDPASALLFSALFLGERLAAPQIMGAILILGGTAYSQLTILRKRPLSSAGEG